MFCSECGKKISENSKFCKYCGASMKSMAEDDASVIKNYSLSDYTASKRKTSIESGSWIKCAAIVGVCILLISIFSNYHECDRCDKQYVGDAYFDCMDADYIMCEDCAKSYYMGLNYTQFRVQ